MLVPISPILVSTTIPGDNIPGTMGSVNTMDATGEGSAIVGEVQLSTGPGTSATISSAGGKLFLKTNSSTWADAATVVRCGVQDPTAASLPDDSWDVYADQSPGSGVIASNSYCGVAMTNGSKTLTHGDRIAIVLEMTNRAGADSVTISGYLQTQIANWAYPVRVHDVGAGWVKLGNGGSPPYVLLCDDGTLAWILPWNGPAVGAAYSTVAGFGLDTTPDEYCGTFQVPVPVTVCALRPEGIGSVTAGTEDFEIILYRDPFGSSPVALRTETFDSDRSYAGGGQGGVTWPITPYTCWPGIDYAVGVRPLAGGASVINQQYVNVGTANARLKDCGSWFVGQTVRMASRTGNSGAFTETDPGHLPLFAIEICEIDNGAALYRARPNALLRR